MGIPDVRRVIDAHTHLFAPEIVKDRGRHLERDAWFGELYASPKTILVTPDDLIASMDEAGIEVSVICGWPWRDMGLCREHNKFLADVKRMYPDRIAWLGIVNPAAADAPAEIEESLRNGASGVGELNADAQGFDWQRPNELEAAMNVCVQSGIPVLMHCSEPVGHAYPGKGTATPEKILRFLDAFPDLSVVAAHWGGGLPFYELMPEVASLTKNVVYDSAASTYLYRFDIFPVLSGLLGNGRVVFGSDYPLLKQRAFLDRTLASGIDVAALPDLLAGTAERVYGLTTKVANP